MWSFGSTFTYDYGEDKPPEADQRYPTTCSYCGIHSDAEVLATYNTNGGKYISLPASEMQLYTVVLRCTRCRGVMTILWPYGTDLRGVGLTTTRVKLPFPQAASNVFGDDAKYVPSAVLEDLRQAEVGFQAGSTHGAGLLLRRACQNLCRDKSCKRGSLAEEIDALYPEHITAQMKQTAHSVRLIGNEIAHPDPHTPATVTAQDVRDCWDFLTELIRVIYVHPGRQATLRKRMEAKDKRANSGEQSSAQHMGR